MSNVPTILHEQQGLVIRKNQKNGVVVARLHYTADPAKRESWWIEEAKQGMSDAKYRQEYEIDYTAIFGQKVFEEISNYRQKIVVRGEYPEIPPTAPCYGGFDFGMRSPSAFYVFVIMKNADGEPSIYVVWEHYKPTSSMSELVSDLLACPYWDRVKWVAADIHLWDKNQTDVAGANTTRFNQLVQLGVKKLIKGNADEARWITMMKDHWYDLEHRDPTFKIFDTCPNLIQEFENAKYPTMTEAQSMISNFKEKIVDVDNHGMDACKYFMNAGPRIGRKKDEGDRERTKPKEFWRRYWR